MHVKQGDTVVVISGKDKGKVGKVLTVFPKEQRIIVEGVNMVTKHMKATPQMQQGGILHQEGKIHASNVLLYNKQLKKGVRTRSKRLDDNKKVRVCAKTGEVLD